jgi:2',3'-cyclic-nucleotide 2'-phosphodiesterase (5'-nucleotidase family)
MINKIRGEENPVLLLDCGGFFPNKFSRTTQEFIANVGLKAVNVMDYTAMNLSTGEFSLGVNFLKEKSADLNFPLVASNLSYADGASPFTKKYVITQAGSLKVAILGVMSPGILEKMPRSGTFGIVEVTPPGEALESLLPGIRKEANIVILLSQLGLSETKRLVGALKGIDLAIYGGKDNKPAKCGKEINPESSAGKSGTPALKASSRGTHLGYVRLSVDDTGRVIADNKRMIYLNKSVAMDDKVLEITGNDINKLISEKKKRSAEEKQRRMERDIEALRKLTPMEYIEMLNKKQAEGEDKR